MFSQSVSGKLFNILAQKVVLFIYIHDNAQIIAQVNVLTNLRKKAAANTWVCFRSGQNPNRIAVATKFVATYQYLRYISLAKLWF